MEVFLVLAAILSPLFFPVHGLDINSVLEKPSSSYEAIYQFGDSINDNGNLVRMHRSDRCGRVPYGQNFFHHRATGRCSNGLLMIDFFAQALDLPLLDPYLGKHGNFTHGVNFAVAGSTALNASTLAAKNIYAGTSSTLLVQLDWFRSHLNNMYSNPSESVECRTKLGKALFIVGEIGGNDYNYAAFQGKTMEDLQALLPEVVRTTMNAVKELIKVGAKRIIVPGNFPVGCMTIYLVLFKTHDLTMYDELNCLRSWNEFAMFHNNQLQNAIRDLQKEHSDVAIVYGDYYTAMRSILKQASSLGFDEDGLYKACCGRGNNEYNYDPRHSCGSPGVPVCADPSKRVNWDGIHLTQHAYQLMAKWLLKDIVPTTTSGSVHAA